MWSLWFRVASPFWVYPLFGGMIWLVWQHIWLGRLLSCLELDLKFKVAQFFFPKQLLSGRFLYSNEALKATIVGVHIAFCLFVGLPTYFPEIPSTKATSDGSSETTGYQGVDAKDFFCPDWSFWSIFWVLLSSELSSEVTLDSGIQRKHSGSVDTSELASPFINQGHCTKHTFSTISQFFLPLDQWLDR